MQVTLIGFVRQKYNLKYLFGSDQIAESNKAGSEELQELSKALFYIVTSTTKVS